MVSSTTGRRHARAGALTVAELVRRQPPATVKTGVDVDRPAPDRSTRKGPVANRPLLDRPRFGDFPSDRPVNDVPTSVLPVLKESEQADATGETGENTAAERFHSGRLVLVSKIAGIGFGVLALCGAFGAASVITTHHQRDLTAAGSPVLLPISGMQALRPDVLAAQLTSGNAKAHRVADGRGTTTPSKSAQDQSEPQVAVPDDQLPGSDQPSVPTGGQQAGKATKSPTEVVRQFFSMVRQQPHAAAQLLDPQLLGSQLTEFVTAWSSTAALEVEQVTQTKSGPVEAVVRLLQPNGTWLRVDELLTVTSDRVPLIGHVQLLSAQNG